MYNDMTKEELIEIIHKQEKEIKSLNTNLFYENERNTLLELKLYNYNEDYFKKDRVTQEDVLKHSSRTGKIIPIPKRR